MSHPSALSKSVERLREGWPPGFVVAQFPNTPLLIAMGAYLAGAFSVGWVDACARAVFYVALGVWAYWEVADGVNWFRRVLGVAALAYVVVRIARALHGA